MKFLLASFLITLSSQAGTYYIDYQAGSDANNAASPTNPWQRHPYMAGFGGYYNHSAGDQFIFKGGVTWPRSCFQLHITRGGQSDSLRDYYGVNPGWYSGVAWSRPVFDFEDTQIGSGWNSSAGVWFDTVNYIIFDNIELKRHRAPVYPPGSDWGAATLNLFGSAAYITIQNCYVHDWSIPTPATGQDGGGSGGLAQVNGGGAGVVVTGCTFHQANASVRSGCAVRLAGELSFCEIYQTPNGFLGGGLIHDNHIHDITGATDPAAHPNAIYTFGPSTIYNNRIHNLDSGTSAIYVSPSFSGGTGYDWIYNNIVYAVGYQAPVQIDLEGAFPALTGSHVYNNILEHGSGFCVRVVQRGTAVLGLLDVQNNQLLTTSTTPVCYAYPAAGCAFVNAVTVQNNTVLSPSEGNIPGVSNSSPPPPPSPSPSPSPTPTPTPTPTPDSSGPVLVNGSFESRYTGWTESGNQRVIKGSATDGTVLVQFNYGQQPANGMLSQSFATTPGRSYTVTYDLGAYSLVNHNEQRMLVIIQGDHSGLSELISVFALGNGTRWTAESLSFVADSSTTTLIFQDVSPSTDSVDLLLDNVRITGQ